MTINKDQIFFIRYLLPIVTSILTLVVISQFYMTTLKQSDLLTITGKVQSIKQDRYKHYKYTDDRITIILSESVEPFYFFETNFSYFPTIMTNINIGDTITLSHRTKIQSRLGTGSEYKIMQIKKAEKLIYSFEDAKKSFKNVGSFTTYVAFGMWTLYLFLIIKLRKQKGYT
jgi:hypothetical protein